MTKINVDYKKLEKTSKNLEDIVFGKDGLEDIGNRILEVLSSISRNWVDEGHFEHINQLEKVFNNYREYYRFSDKLRVLMAQAALEYKKAADETVNEVNKI